MTEGANFQSLSRPAPLAQQHWPEGTVPLVSVSCTTYNQQRWIGECLDSILRQETTFPVEIVIHDDASTDGTAKLIETYRERFPQLIHPILQSENQWSLNRAIRRIFTPLLRGKYVAHCDGDDVWLDTEKLSKQVDYLERFPEMVLCYHDAVKMTADGDVSPASIFPEKCKRDYTQEDLRIMKWGWMLMGTVMFRNLLSDFPPEYDLIPNGDNFVPMLLGAHGGAGYLADVQPLAYRQHDQSVWTGQPVQKKISMHLQSYLQICAYFVRVGEPKNAITLMASRLRRSMNEYFETMRATGQIR